jgi:hypothetical protein
MNNPSLVRGFEGLRDLSRNRERLFDADNALRDTVRERGPLD